VRKVASASSTVFGVPARVLSKRLRALIGLGGVGDRGFGHVDVSLLQIRIDGEQRHGLLHSIAFAHRQRLDPARLVGADKDQIGLDPALVTGVGRLRAGRKRQNGYAYENDATRFHAASPGPNSTSKCARISARTSMGSKRSNKPLQMIATMPGAASNCGKRTSASVLSSPRSWARRSMARIVPHHPRNDFPIVEFGELGKARAFGEDKTDHVLAARLENLASEHLDQLIGDHAEWNLCVGDVLQRRNPQGLSSMRTSSSNSVSLSAKCR